MTAQVDGWLVPRSWIVAALLAFVAGGIAVYAWQRHAAGAMLSSDASAQGQAQTQAHAEPRRPALTADEERYIRALWPIHGDVERSTMRMSLGQIFYKTQGLGRDELATRVKDALVSYQAAQKRLAALQPPPSLRGGHDTYVAAVRLFNESAAEVMKMFSDARDDHMLAAYPGSQEASNKIREVGGKFWPHEFPPH